MLDGLLGMLGYLAQIYFVSGKAPEPVGSKHASIVPYGSFPTRDGHVIVACLTERFWQNFARALGMPELASDPRFSEYAARLKNRDDLDAIIECRMRADDTDFWLRQLNDFDVPNAPILDIAQALEQPHVKARGLVEETFHPAAGAMKVMRTPLRFSGKPLSASVPPPLLGEQSSEVLRGILGLGESRLAELVAGKIVFQAEQT